MPNDCPEIYTDVPGVQLDGMVVEQKTVLRPARFGTVIVIFKETLVKMFVLEGQNMMVLLFGGSGCKIDEPQLVERRCFENRDPVCLMMILVSLLTVISQRVFPNTSNCGKVKSLVELTVTP